MIDKINANQVQDLLGKSSSKPPHLAKGLKNADLDVSLQVDYAALIDKAKQIPETDSKAVHQARQLLESGELETLEHCEAATENIVKFGI